MGKKKSSPIKRYFVESKLKICILLSVGGCETLDLSHPGRGISILEYLVREVRYRKANRD